MFDFYIYSELVCGGVVTAVDLQCEEVDSLKFVMIFFYLKQAELKPFISVFHLTNIVFLLLFMDRRMPILLISAKHLARWMKQNLLLYISPIIHSYWLLQKRQRKMIGCGHFCIVIFLTRCLKGGKKFPF